MCYKENWSERNIKCHSSFLTVFPPGDDLDESSRQISAESPQSPHEDMKPLKCHKQAQKLKF